MPGRDGVDGVAPAHPGRDEPVDLRAEVGVGAGSAGRAGAPPTTTVSSPRSPDSRPLGELGERRRGGPPRASWSAPGRPTAGRSAPNAATRSARVAADPVRRLEEHRASGGRRRAAAAGPGAPPPAGAGSPRSTSGRPAGPRPPEPRSRADGPGRTVTGSVLGGGCDHQPVAGVGHHRRAGVGHEQDDPPARRCVEQRLASATPRRRRSRRPPAPVSAHVERGGEPSSRVGCPRRRRRPRWRAPPAAAATRPPGCRSVSPRASRGTPPSCLTSRAEPGAGPTMTPMSETAVERRAHGRDREALERIRARLVRPHAGRRLRAAGCYRSPSPRSRRCMRLWRITRPGDKVFDETYYAHDAGTCCSTASSWTSQRGTQADRRPTAASSSTPRWASG